MGADRTISIHAPRTGSDTQSAPKISPPCRFQSTLPARGATFRDVPNARVAEDFNPRSPHGERLQRHRPRCGRLLYFNPRSPHGERRRSMPQASRRRRFQSTLPARGATMDCLTGVLVCDISIHAPRTGSDAFPCLAARAYSNFNPRSPHGERPQRTTAQSGDAGNFNPRSPHGERRRQPDMIDFRAISIHAPRTGSDDIITAGRDDACDFNPRSPHGERLRKVTILSIRIIGFAQKVYHKTVLLRISLAENAVILPEKPRNPVRTSLQKAGGLRFARAIRAARPYSISSPSGA